MFGKNILILLSLLSNELHAVCQESPKQGLIRRDTFYQDFIFYDSALFHLEKGSNQKVQTLLQDKKFRDVVLELQQTQPQPQSSEADREEKLLIPEDSRSPASPRVTRTRMVSEEASLYIFVSFSLGEKALLNLAQEAKQFGATLVLRGFREGSYRKTAQALQKIITKTVQGVIIDPELYSLFNIAAVPTFVMAKPFHLQAQMRIQTPIHDKLQGHVSVHYALEVFAKAGDLKEEAHLLLKTGGMK